MEGAPNNWIPTIGAGYYLGIDGISFLLIMLTTLLGAISILSSWTAIQDRGEGILHLVPGAADRHARRLHVAGLLPVLRLLGSHAGADVSADRHLGRPAQAVCGHQVLSLHPAGLGADAAERPVPVLLPSHADRRLHLQHSGALPHRAADSAVYGATAASCCSSGSSSASPSRFPCSPSTPGCRMRTWKRRRRARSSWPAFC